jgi:hypothetical protein
MPIMKDSTQKNARQHPHLAGVLYLLERSTMLQSLLSFVLLVFSCSLTVAQTAPAISKSPISVYDGFEEPTLGSIWMTSLLAPGSYAIQSDIVRAGHSALRITVRPHDNSMPGTERDELAEAFPQTTRLSVPYEFSWSMYVSAEFPIVPVRLVVAQWWEWCHSSDLPCINNSPVLAVRYINGVLLITQDLNHHYNVLYQEKRELRGHWLDLRFQVRFTPQSNGFVRAWLDGKQVVDFAGATSNPENTESGYTHPIFLPFRMGLYRNAMSQPMTLYFDEYRKRQLSEDELTRPAKTASATSR